VWQGLPEDAVLGCITIEDVIEAILKLAIDDECDQSNVKAEIAEAMFFSRRIAHLRKTRLSRAKGSRGWAKVKHAAIGSPMPFDAWGSSWGGQGAYAPPASVPRAGSIHDDGETPLLGTSVGSLRMSEATTRRLSSRE
jgi:hypothetical protein